MSFLKADSSFDELIYSDVPLQSNKEENIQEQVLNAIDSYYALYPEKAEKFCIVLLNLNSSAYYSPLDAMRRSHFIVWPSFVPLPELIEEKRGYNLYTASRKLIFINFH
ncbi:hypothetical protein OH492_28745 [Vibrio chagasii]|nr:hypothetical protein [Vibrio chagasii]